MGYLQHLGAAENMSQLLQAELAYLCFMGADCPLLYHATEKQWFVYEQYWRAQALSGPKVLFQDAETGFIPAAKKALPKAESEDVFPPVGNGAKENPCLTFLKDLVEQLESREGVEKVINESAMLFWPEADPVFDMNPALFQLANAVVDLRDCTVRRGKPSDMTSMASPIAWPEKGFDDTGLVEAEGEPYRDQAWGIMWSTFHRAGDFHPDDHVEELGDQDLANFYLLLKIHARSLEGRPTCRLPFLWSKRGRNSKGINEKILQAFHGSYYSPVRPSVFQQDRRGENEHSAGELGRRGVRVAFANEVGAVPWANSVFKNKVSSDPFTARGCGAAAPQTIKPTHTIMFASNDRPVWEQTPKGSERDRFGPIVYFPNKYVDVRNNLPDSASSPRTFPKDYNLEDKIASQEFGLGHLLNLLQVRMQVAREGRSLDRDIAEGTPTSAFWLEKWFAEWTAHEAARRGDGADEDYSETAAQEVREHHMRLVAEKKAVLLSVQVQNDQNFGPGRSASKWTDFVNLVSRSGNLGKLLFQSCVEKSRKGTNYPGYRIAPVDLFTYDVLFGNADIFGALKTYRHADGLKSVGENSDLLSEEDVAPRSVPAGDMNGPGRVAVCAAVEVVNLGNLEERHEQGASQTMERRPETLQGWITWHREHGVPVGISGTDLVDPDQSGLDTGTGAKLSQALREFVQIDGVGRAYQVGPGVQGATRESRPVGLAPFVVGEFDMKKAFYQIVVREVKAVLREDIETTEFFILVRYLQFAGPWVQKVGDYYSITEEQAKGIFQRLPFKGRLGPNADWDASNADHRLPCLRELLFAFERARALLAEKNTRYQEIMAMPKVQGARDPEVSAFALFLMDVEHRILCKIAESSVKHGAHVLSYVFDGLYVLAASEGDLVRIFKATQDDVLATTGIQLALKDASGQVLDPGVEGFKRAAVELVD